MRICEIADAQQKSRICDQILNALPNWFGIESSIMEYTQDVRKQLFFAAFNCDSPIGFLAVKQHNAYTAEVCVMGIMTACHRQGIGKALIQEAEGCCVRNGLEFLTVKTLDASRADEGYEKTRSFYLAMGFRPLEVFPMLWDEDNPCLFMAKSLMEK